MVRKSAEDRGTSLFVSQHRWLEERQYHKDIETKLDKEILAKVQQYLTNGRLKRVALHIIAWVIDDTAIAHLRNLFLSVDKDHSGTLSIDEMHEAVSKIDTCELEKAGMVQIMCQLDPTGSDIIEYTHFLAATLSKEQYLQPVVCKAAFHRLDVDHDGVLSRRDLARLLADEDNVRDVGLVTTSLCELVTELEQIMAEADENQDGGICFDEFMQVMEADASLPAAPERSFRRKRSQSEYLARVTALETLPGKAMKNSSDEKELERTE